MKNFKVFIFLVGSLLVGGMINHVTAQYSFELVHGSSNSIEGTSYTLEKDGHYYSFGVRTDSSFNQQSPIVLKISADGLLEQEGIFQKQDTMYGFHSAYPKANGNLFVIGYLKHYQNPRHKVIYVCELTTNLEVVWEKMDSIPFSPPYSGVVVENTLITPDGFVLLQGKLNLEQYGSTNYVFFAIYDLEGNQIDFVSHLSCIDNSYGSELLYNVDSTAFYLIGRLTHNIAYRNYIKFGLDLSVIESGELECNTSFLFVPVSAKRLSNGNVIMANRSTQINGTDHSDLEMRLYDENFNLLKDTIIYHDERVAIPSYRGLGFVNEELIWVATHEQMWTSHMGTEVFRVFVFDNQLKLKGKKVFGGESRIWLWDLFATSDGGCILTGSIPEYEGSNYTDCYLIKVMPDDVVTKTSNSLYNRKTEIFPLPTNDILNVNNIGKPSKLILYDIVGNQLDSFQLNIGDNIIKLDLLKPGVYIGAISQNGIYLENFKIIKK